MWLDWNIFLISIVFQQQFFAVEMAASKLEPAVIKPPLLNRATRERRLLGLIGYLTGASDNTYRLIPSFWREWSAVLQLNVQKKNIPSPENTVLIPGYFLYAPLQPPHSPHPHLPHPHPNEFDTVTSSLDVDTSIETSASASASSVNKIPNDALIETNVIQSSTANKSKQNQMNDADRKTRKRGIDRKNYVEMFRDDSEQTEEADVKEITTKPNIIENTSKENGIELMTTTVESSVEESGLTTASIEDSQTEGSASTNTAISTVLDPTKNTNNFSSQIMIDQSASGEYYGGTPLDNADFIYITTTDGPTPLAISATGSYNIQNAFRASVPYEFANYRYDPDQHFVPIVGNKQIF